MILLEYLFWILFLGYGYFAAIRFQWLFEKVEGHPFWLKANAKNFHIAAGVLFFAVSLMLLQRFHVIFLLVLLLGEYLLVASPAVKVTERGIMANALMARWPDIVRVQQTKTPGEVLILTKHAWLKLRLQVPPDKAPAFRKILAAKALTILAEDETTAAENFEAAHTSTTTSATALAHVVEANLA